MNQFTSQGKPELHETTTHNVILVLTYIWHTNSLSVTVIHTTLEISQPHSNTSRRSPKRKLIMLKPARVFHNIMTSK